MADSFHPARLTRLGLAHQRHRESSKAGAERREEHALLQLDEFPTATQWILSVSHSVPSVSLWFTRLLPHCASAPEISSSSLTNYLGSITLVVD